MRLLTLIFILVFQTVQLAAMDVSAQWAFFLAGQQPFAELYLHFSGKSLKFQPLASDTQQVQAQVEVILLFKQNDTIQHFDKILIQSPNTEQASISFIDQRRYALPQGVYVVELLIIDVNDTTNTYFVTDTLRFLPQTGLNFSDIQLLSNVQKDTTNNEGAYFKNGLFLESLPHSFAHRGMSTLQGYAELYGSETLTDDISITTAIYPAEGGEQKTAAFIFNKRRKPSAVIPHLFSADIAQLPSGNYQLVLSVRDKNRNLLCEKSSFFQRSNPYLEFDPDSLGNEDLEISFVNALSIDSLKYSLRAIAMQINPTDGEIIQTLYNSLDTAKMRLYLLSYWLGVSPNHPDLAFKKYMNVVRALDYKYANGFGFGFESDRGWAFLKYGRPDDLTAVETDPTAPPYEIWTYYNLEKTNQRNVKFVFYNPSLVANGHRLLHSTARGEMNNPRWQVILYNNAPNEQNGNPVDATEMQNNWGRDAGRIYNDQ